ncbi:MAG: NAD(+) synthase [Candidatus Cloacimonetes bacterium 4572_55]|nr:MAG: NAD(+) synthase [Candidatus Cloacimonetes bacterium 4572_55]
MNMKPFSTDILRFDNPEAVCEKIEEEIRRIVFKKLKRKGAVVAISGGIDSSVCAALCQRALGSERVIGLLLPERDSDPDSEKLARKLADQLEIETRTEIITATLEGFGCYARRDEAIRIIFPDYQSDWKHKVILPQNLLDSNRINISHLVVENPDGEQFKKRLPLKAYLQIVASVNFKQRTRKVFEYYHADRLNRVVVGTPNLLEYDQGFFVKLGDGAADIKPIAHLYKTQVYQLGQYMGLPEDIVGRTPTTDTYSLPQTQEEFYFALPYREMDLILYAYNHKISAEEAGKVLNLTGDQVRRVYRDMVQKRRSTAYLHSPPLLIEEPLISQ